MASKEAISKLTREIFGQLPNRQIRTGHQHLKKRLVGVYNARYYPESIDSAARMVHPGYLNDQEERRKLKLEQMRRNGKGPPKKGSGKRKK